MMPSRYESKDAGPVQEPWLMTVNHLGADPLLAALREHHSRSDVRDEIKEHLGH